MKDGWVTFWVVENYHSCSSGTEKAVLRLFRDAQDDCKRAAVTGLQLLRLKKPITQGFSQ